MVTDKEKVLAFDIIKNRRVNVDDLMLTIEHEAELIKDGIEPWRYYNTHNKKHLFPEEEIDENEYNFLKGVLKK